MANTRAGRDFQRMSMMGGSLLLADDNNPNGAGRMAFAPTAKTAFPAPSPVRPAPKPQKVGK